MEDFALEGLKELYKQEKKKLEELESKEIEKALCDTGVELLKDIELPADNPALTQAAEEKHREFFERKKRRVQVLQKNTPCRKPLCLKLKTG